MMLILDSWYIFIKVWYNGNLAGCASRFGEYEFSPLQWGWK